LLMSPTTMWGICAWKGPQRQKMMKDEDEGPPLDKERRKRI
jgi:hypothetical protein